MTSRNCARRLPLASWMPQKTLGSLPCPIVYSVQITWLPCGSNFYQARGRGVAPLGHAVAGHMVWVETGTNQIGWMLPNSSPASRLNPTVGQTSAKGFRCFIGHEVSHHVIARP